MKSLLRSFVLALVGIFFSIATNVFIGIYGWGLTPHNWWVLIFGSVCGTGIALAFVELSKD